MNFVRRGWVMLFLSLALAGCGSISMPEPIDIGRDRDALKQSPCACDEIRQDYRSWSRWG